MYNEEYENRGFPFRDFLLKLILIIIFVFLVPYSAAVYKGLGSLFSAVFPGVETWVWMLIIACLTGIYLVAGGYVATSYTDLIQGIIMLFGIVAVIAAVLKGQGGFMAALQGLAEVEDPAASAVPGVFNSFLGPDPLNLLGVVLLTSLGTWGLPQMVQKFYAIKSEKAISKGMIISTVFAMVVAGGCYFLGGFARLYGDRVDVAAEGYDAIIPAMISDLSPLLIAVVVVLVLSVTMYVLNGEMTVADALADMKELADEAIEDAK